MRNVKQEFCVTTLFLQCDLLGLSLSVALSVVCFQIKYVFCACLQWHALGFFFFFWIDLPIYIPDINVFHTAGKRTCSFSDGEMAKTTPDCGLFYEQTHYESEAQIKNPILKVFLLVC